MSVTQYNIICAQYNIIIGIMWCVSYGHVIMLGVRYNKWQKIRLIYFYASVKSDGVQYYCSAIRSSPRNISCIRKPHTHHDIDSKRHSFAFFNRKQQYLMTIDDYSFLNTYYNKN